MPADLVLRWFVVEADLVLGCWHRVQRLWVSVASVEQYAFICSPEDGGSIFSRNVGNTAYCHAVPTRKYKMSVR